MSAKIDQRLRASRSAFWDYLNSLDGWRVIRSASDEESRWEHWDLLASYNNKQFRFKFKSRNLKKNSETFGDEVVLVELHGSHINDKGWVYGSLANIVVFEMSDHYIAVRRGDLIKLVDKLAAKHGFSKDGKPLTRQQTGICYNFTLYQRPNYHDRFIYIPSNLVRKIGVAWEK